MTASESAGGSEAKLPTVGVSWRKAAAAQVPAMLEGRAAALAALPESEKQGRIEIMALADQVARLRADALTCRALTARGVRCSRPNEVTWHNDSDLNPDPSVSVFCAQHRPATDVRAWP